MAPETADNEEETGRAKGEAASDMQPSTSALSPEEDDDATSGTCKGAAECLDVHVRSGNSEDTDAFEETSSSQADESKEDQSACGVPSASSEHDHPKGDESDANGVRAFEGIPATSSPTEEPSRPTGDAASEEGSSVSSGAEGSHHSLHSAESMMAIQSMALNDAFMALETMRKANLELELSDMGGKVDHRCCTQCLRDRRRKELERVREGKRRRGWARSFSRRRAALPCLVCASPVCAAHSCPDFRRDKVTICGECAPLFGADFIFEIVFSEDKAHRRACVDKVVDRYDRALLILKYSSQYVDDVAQALRQNTERDNTVALGSSGVGIVSGITGVAAAAVHIAGAAVVGAAILTPAGPPLFIASLIFGGTAAAASTGTEAVSYYSEPNQMASRIMALHELVNSLLQVTLVLKDALTHGRINLNHYVDRKQKKKDMTKIKADLKIDSVEGDNVEKCGSGADQDSASEAEKADDASIATAQTDISEGVDDYTPEKDSSGVHLEAAACQLPLGDSCSVRDSEDDSPTHAEPSLDASQSNDGLVAKDTDAAKSPSSSSDRKSPTKQETKVVSSRDNKVRRTICRAATNTMKAASAASAACGVLSVTTIILEAKNMTDSLERMKAGNKCEKAEILLAIKAEVDKLPDTSMIASECESYLKGPAVDEARPAALTVRQREEAKACSASRRGLPIRFDD